jgi:hypothetical protein
MSPKETNTNQNQSVTIEESNILKDNFELVTKENTNNGLFSFLLFGVFLVLCAGLVYFLRAKKSKILPGDDFEII